jgi:hypothetical protein
MHAKHMVKTNMLANINKISQKTCGNQYVRTDMVYYIYFLIKIYSF